MDAVAAFKARVVTFIASIPHDLAAREDRIGKKSLQKIRPRSQNLASCIAWSKNSETQQNPLLHAEKAG